MKRKNTREYHGLCHSRLYRIWKSMKVRCLNKNNKSYRDYGGRGISVCSEWQESFSSFYEWSINNGYKENLTLDRINFNGNYAPDNCKWSTLKEQMNNTRKNIFLEYDGDTKTVKEWAETLGVSQYTLYSRVKKGWSIADIIEKPIRRKRIITINGESHSIEEWAEISGIPVRTLYNRVKRNETGKKLLSVTNLRRK